MCRFTSWPRVVCSIAMTVPPLHLCVSAPLREQLVARAVQDVRHGKGYLAYSIDRVSRITLTLIWPG